MRLAGSATMVVNRVARVATIMLIRRAWRTPGTTVAHLYHRRVNAVGSGLGQNHD
jgi:hypothetical protein